MILGSMHYISRKTKPTNCLYVISPSGEIVDRYDKCMCTPFDLKVYTPGNHLATITLNGIKCGFLICADCGNPNLYHAYRDKGVKVIFHSYYNARFEGPIDNDRTVTPLNRAKAREHGMWVIANNSSARHSCWPTFVAGPDRYFRSLKRHVPGILFHEILPGKLARDTFYHTGKTSRHSRAVDTRSLP